MNKVLITFIIFSCMFLSVGRASTKIGINWFSVFNKNGQLELQASHVFLGAGKKRKAYIELLGCREGKKKFLVTDDIFSSFIIDDCSGFDPKKSAISLIYQRGSSLTEFENIKGSEQVSFAETSFSLNGNEIVLIASAASVSKEYVVEVFCIIRDEKKLILKDKLNLLSGSKFMYIEKFCGSCEDVELFINDIIITKEHL